MKKSFEELFEEIKQSDSPEFNEMYESAKKEKALINKSFIIVNIIIVVFLMLIFKISYNSLFTVPFIFMPLLVADFIIYIVIVSIFSKNSKLYSQTFKLRVIRKIFSNFYDVIEYTPTKQIPKSIYNEAKYNEYYNRYVSDDYMEGKIDSKYFIQMAEVHTIDEETSTDANGNTTTTSTTKFHGLFAKIELNKSINNSLLIRKNHSISKKNRLDMDSQDFEKVFDVSSSNQIIGMQLLTHDVMELLLSFKDTTGITFDISIYNNIMYLRFHTGSVFELKSLKKGAFDEEMLKKYYNILDFTYKLSKMLIDLIEETKI